LDRLFGEEFVEDVLMWHIVTCMVLLHPRIGDEARKHACAIEVMSEYLMFLVAVRQEMLPGLVLHSQLEITRKKLVQICNAAERSDVILHNEKSNRNNKEKLAMILRRVTAVEPDESDEAWASIPHLLEDEGSQLVLRAVELYFKLSGDKKAGVGSSRDARPPPQVPGEMLEFIFNVWVDKLVYAAVRCSREAHAQQLTAGGELTTVLWMLIQHAGPFGIGEEFINVSKKKKGAKDPMDMRPEHGEPFLAAGPPMPGDPFPARQQKEVPPPPPMTPPPPPPMAPSTPLPPNSPPPLTLTPSLPLPMAPSTPLPWPSPLPSNPPLPPCCPVCPPFYHPSYPPVCTPYYDASWPPVCPWYPQCTPQPERPGDEPEEAREDEHQDSSSHDYESKE